MGEKAYRTKIYLENKEHYKELRSEFVYGISKHFKGIRTEKRKEIERLEEETLMAELEGERYDV